MAVKAEIKPEILLERISTIPNGNLLTDIFIRHNLSKELEADVHQPGDWNPSRTYDDYRFQLKTWVDGEGTEGTWLTIACDPASSTISLIIIDGKPGREKFNATLSVGYCPGLNISDSSEWQYRVKMGMHGGCDPNSSAGKYSLGIVSDFFKVASNLENLGTQPDRIILAPDQDSKNMTRKAFYKSLFPQE